MRRAHAMLGLGAAMLFAATASLTLLPGDTQASATQATFIVPAADGYGVEECLVSGHACGQQVADTWCEAQGYVRALSFHRTASEEITGAIGNASVASKDEPVTITCSN